MYCQKIVGDAEFSIEQWNIQFKLCNELGLDMPSMNDKQCEKQCFDCAAIVAARRLQTQELLKKK